jgi:DNA-binding NarL/FixJ family response regulator
MSRAGNTRPDIMISAGPELPHAQPEQQKGDMQLSVAQASFPAWPVRGRRPAQLLNSAQKKMMQLMADGLTCKEIAWELNLTHATVKVYASQMYKDLRMAGYHVVDKASVVALGLRKGWIK